MTNQIVFTSEKERMRLETQRQLMQTCEAPVFRELFAGKTGLKVLDIGCNDGEKTVCWFADPAVDRVLGLEYNAELARHAHAVRGDGVFSFYPCDVEAEGFSERLADLMQRERIDGFDVIYLSFVLSHLRAPETLLRRLRPLLLPGGTLVAVETDDSLSVLEPDEAGLLRGFLELLALDPFAGDRSTGKRLLPMLRCCGFRRARLCCDAIGAGPGERSKKEQIFEMFFSYLPEDAALLCAEAPEGAHCLQMERWLEENYEQLKRLILSEEAQISMGMSVVSCSADDIEAERSARP